jgi:hypothetical protein
VCGAYQATRRRQTGYENESLFEKFKYIIVIVT